MVSTLFLCYKSYIAVVSVKVILHIGHAFWTVTCT
jgi:hypothetical protein